MTTPLAIARAAAAAAVIALAPALLSRASAQDAPGCPGALRTWTAACAGDAVRLAECPAGHAIFTVGPGRLRVDVSRRTERAFVAIGELGASPIGQFSDWREVPEADRAAFDALVHCARERPEALVEELAAAPPAPSSAEPRRVGSLEWPTPWRVLLAALIVIVVLASSARRASLAEAVAIAGLSAVTFLARRVLVAEAYFHQNGQGPLWISHALGEPSSYGPGHAQVFHWIASRAADPDGAVFLLQGALCALVPAAAFAIARGVGAPRTIAWPAAIAVALSPIEARLAQSESYFATSGALIAIAGAVLAICVRPEAGTRSNIAGSCAAGLLVAQAALVHPLCWLAAALLPIVVLVGAGETRARLRLGAIATGSIAAVVIVAAGPALLAVLTGPLGAQWLGPVHDGRGREVPDSIVLACVAALTMLALAARYPRLRAAGLAAASLSIVVVVGWAGNLLGAAPPWVHHAYRWLHLAPTLAAAAALSRELCALAAVSKHARREALARWLGASAVVVVAIAWYAASFAETTTLSTDAREAALVREWRDLLPRGAVVAHLERADRQIVILPLYDRRDARLFADRSPADLTTLGRDVFWYRSGLCTTVRGRAFCEAIEAQHDLEAVHVRALPALPSMEGLDYDRPEVEVGLYRVRDRRSPSTTDDGSSEVREGR